MSKEQIHFCASNCDPKEPYQFNSLIVNIEAGINTETERFEPTKNRIMAGNPNWKKGGESPNPAGRKKTKYSVRTPKGMIENFIKKNLTYRQLQRMFDELDSKDQFKVLTELLPYIMPKQNSLTADINFEALSDRDLDTLYQKVTENMTIDLVPKPPSWFGSLEYGLPESIKQLSDQQVEERLKNAKDKLGINFEEIQDGSLSVITVVPNSNESANG